MPMRVPRTAVFLALTAAIFAGSGSTVMADIDPASDVLLLQDVFLPYQPKVCSQVSDALRNLTKSSKKAGFPVKVAVIASRNDLGGAANMFGQPQKYAQFLGNELGVYAPDVGRNFTSQDLVVAMPQGLAVSKVGTNSAQAVNAVPAPRTGDSNRLARAAFAAVPKLAQAAGHPVKAPKLGSGCSKSGSSSFVLIFGAPLAVLIVIGVFAGLRRRTRPSEAS
jgi:hypothetical protein